MDLKKVMDAGWTVGAVKEFLGTTDVEERVIEERLAMKLIAEEPTKAVEKWYEVRLPVFKKGDDLQRAIKENNGNIEKALTDLADIYSLAESMCLEMAQHARDVYEVVADGHTIQVLMDPGVAGRLVEDTILQEADWDGEE